MSSEYTSEQGKSGINVSRFYQKTKVLRISTYLECWVLTVPDINWRIAKLNCLNHLQLLIKSYEMER